jgi:exodeoxyribonuclease X
MTTAIILDTETTAIENPEVIELAWADYNNSAFRSRRLYRPVGEISYGALAVHHILLEDIGADPKAGDSHSVYHDIPSVDYWIGHNIDFDWKALGSPPIKRICTLAMCRNLWPEVDSHSLSAMAYFLLGRTPETRERLRHAHSALADVELCIDILNIIQHVAKTTSLEDLYAFSEDARVPRLMTFGKFKGQPISAVDKGYANWYRRQSDTDPYVIEAFRREGLV